MDERARRAAVVSVGMMLGLAVGGGAGGMPLGLLAIACLSALLVAFPAAYLLERPD
jgi:uncharacterized membrane protein YoaK (UPF0700 family)